MEKLSRNVELEELKRNYILDLIDDEMYFNTILMTWGKNVGVKSEHLEQMHLEVEKSLYTKKNINWEEYSKNFENVTDSCQNIVSICDEIGGNFLKWQKILKQNEIVFREEELDKSRQPEYHLRDVLPIFRQEVVDKLDLHKTSYESNTKYAGKAGAEACQKQ